MFVKHALLREQLHYRTKLKRGVDFIIDSKREYFIVK